MKVISLASSNITINNRGRGDMISFGGAGKMIGTITYGFENNVFEMESTPDGGYAVSHNASKMGTIKIDFVQTSPNVDILCEYILWCRDNPELAAAEITITDSTGVMNLQAIDCVPQGYPDNTLQNTPQNRSFTFLCGQIIPKEYLIGGNN